MPLPRDRRYLYRQFEVDMVVMCAPRYVTYVKHAGFEIVSFRHLGQYPSYFMLNGFLFLLASAYKKLIGHVSALNFLQGWIFVTLRKPENSTRL